MKWIVIAMLALPMMGIDKPRQLVPRPEPVLTSSWDWCPQIAQMTLVCFTGSPDTPYLQVTQHPSPGGITIIPHVTEGYYLVEYLGPQDEIIMSVRYPANQCIYREAGGTTP